MTKLVGRSVAIACKENGLWLASLVDGDEVDSELRLLALDSTGKVIEDGKLATVGAQANVSVCALEYQVAILVVEQASERKWVRLYTRGPRTYASEYADFGFVSWTAMPRFVDPLLACSAERVAVATWVSNNGPVSVREFGLVLSPEP